VHKYHHRQIARDATRRHANETVQASAIGCGPVERNLPRQRFDRQPPARTAVARAQGRVVENACQCPGGGVEQMVARALQCTAALGHQPVRSPRCERERAIGQLARDRAEPVARRVVQRHAVNDRTAKSQYPGLSVAGIGHHLVDVGFAVGIGGTFDKRAVRAKSLQATQVAADVTDECHAAVGGNHRPKAAPA
jgi:hypothetical protein